MSDYTEKPWINQYEDNVPVEVNFEQMCLPDFLERSSKLYPYRSALLYRGYKINFNQLNRMVKKMATCFSKLGIQKGDRISIQLPNIIPCVVSYYAALKLGAIVVMINPLDSDREMQHQLEDSGSTLIISLDILAKRSIKLRPRTNLKHIIYTSLGDYLPLIQGIIFPFIAKKKDLMETVPLEKNVHKWMDLIISHPPNPPNTRLHFDDIAVLQYTASITGTPKGVMLSHGNLSKQVQQMRSWFPNFKKGEERMLGALPFFQVFGATAALNFAIYMGWENILVPKPQPDPLLNTIKTFKPTFAPLVPTMYMGMLNHPTINKVDLTSIKGCLSGASQMPIEAIKDFENKTGAIIVEGFGITESSPITHCNPFVKNKRKPGSVGIPVPNTESRIVSMDDGETDMPVGEIGELIVKGPQIMQGYWNKPKITKDAIINGWLYTGHLAKMDEDGYFYIIDRAKELIMSGGYSIYPWEIEDAYYQNPKLDEVCAIGVPHPTRGEAIKLFVVLKTGETTTPEELRTFGLSKLAKYKLPTEFEFRRQLPKTNSGKILRKELKSEELIVRGVK